MYQLQNLTKWFPSIFNFFKKLERNCWLTGMKPGPKSFKDHSEKSTKWKKKWLRAKQHSYQPKLLKYHNQNLKKPWTNEYVLRGMKPGPILPQKFSQTEKSASHRTKQQSPQKQSFSSSKTPRKHKPTWEKLRFVWIKSVFSVFYVFVFGLSEKHRILQGEETLGHLAL